MYMLMVNIVIHKLREPYGQSRMYGIITSAEIRHIVLSILIF